LLAIFCSCGQEADSPWVPGRTRGFSGAPATPAAPEARALWAGPRDENSDPGSPPGGLLGPELGGSGSTRTSLGSTRTSLGPGCSPSGSPARPPAEAPAGISADVAESAGAASRLVGEVAALVRRHGGLGCSHWDIAEIRQCHRVLASLGVVLLDYVAAADPAFRHARAMRVGEGDGITDR
jgi:hypothetical protein